MAPSDADNRSYYDMLSDDEESLLARRARTRNHQAKLDCVLRELELDGDTRGKRVLELGVGYGSHGAAIVQCGHEILRPGHLSAMKITERNLRRWTDAAGARDVRIGPNVFTPNGPAPLIPAYDWADRFLKSHRRLHALSVQICVSGER